MGRATASIMLVYHTGPGSSPGCSVSESAPHLKHLGKQWRMDGPSAGAPAATLMRQGQSLSSVA